MPLINNAVAIPVPSADMGFPGFVQFEMPGQTDALVLSQSTGTLSQRGRTQIRASACNLQLKQDIEAPKQAKSPAFPFSSPYMDKMVHIVKPEIIEGNIEYPVSLSDAASPEEFDPTVDLWNISVDRTYQERLRSFNTYVKYSAPESTFKYKDCFVNSFSISCEQQDIMKINVNLWAKNREKTSFTGRKFPLNSRVVDWHDIFCNLRGQFGVVEGRWLRSFRINVSNNLQRFYTAGSNLLKAQDITPQLRDISGDIILMGRHTWLAEHARNNAEHCSTDSSIEVGYSSPCTEIFAANGFELVIPNVLFYVEEIQISNDIFESKVRWMSLPADKSMHTYPTISGIF
jgi:hypothetical protein